MCPEGIDPLALEVLLTRLDPEVPVPEYAHLGDAGADLVTTRDLVLEPGWRTVVGTGIAIALPAGYAAFVHPRSGLAAECGLGIVNAPGTIDAGYRGEVRVCLINHDIREPVVLRRLDRIAQLVVQRVERVAFCEVAALPESSRAARGYGSTGITAVAPDPQFAGTTQRRYAAALHSVTTQGARTTPQEGC
ncbi:MAG: dUTP diphosphatase [Pseudonocardiaceae bacterium]